MEEPEGLKAAGAALWSSVTAEFELAEHELSLLREACFTADVCAELAGVVEREGVMIRSRLGEVRTHPALVELRNQRVLLARLLVALRVPLGEEEGEGDRPPVRAVRGAYQPRSA
ncbi:hypothetical protein [Allosalinactinospora lopnorensis]|uniref:hypothetical protein n=1 Tax=Allosalinactinospora lopnorensis TaxID=1352348 RepID=UPI000623BBB0|nr:hypothetical protein [Allosalinactinospora lopnorensis]